MVLNIRYMQKKKKNVHWHIPSKTIVSNTVALAFGLTVTSVFNDSSPPPPLQWELYNQDKSLCIVMNMLTGLCGIIAFAQMFLSFYLTWSV